MSETKTWSKSHHCCIFTLSGNLKGAGAMHKYRNLIDTLLGKPNRFPRTFTPIMIESIEIFSNRFFCRCSCLVGLFSQFVVSIQSILIPIRLLTWTFSLRTIYMPVTTGWLRLITVIVSILCVVEIEKCFEYPFQCWSHLLAYSVQNAKIFDCPPHGDWTRHHSMCTVRVVNHLNSAATAMLRHKPCLCLQPVISYMNIILSWAGIANDKLLCVELNT